MPEDVRRPTSGSRRTSAPSEAGRRRGLQHRSGRSGAEHQPFEQRVARQPVGAVDAGARHFASREQLRDRRAAVEIGFNSAHHVVGRRADRNAIAREVQAGWAVARAIVGKRRRTNSGSRCAIVR